VSEGIGNFVEVDVMPWVVDRVLAGTALWCDEWARHAGVAVRLRELAASRSVLLASGQPHSALARARWWVDVFDPTLATITATDGPFRSCRQGHGCPDVDQEPVFSDASTWFSDWFSQVLTRRSADLFWCDRWDRHPEVMLQLNELWVAWEDARRAPGRFLSWWAWAHQTLGYLTAEDGPMAACKTARGHASNWTTLDGRPADL
jgi:hypothetical protein